MQSIPYIVESFCWQGNEDSNGLKNYDEFSTKNIDNRKNDITKILKEIYK